MRILLGFLRIAYKNSKKVNVGRRWCDLPSLAVCSVIQMVMRKL